MTLDHIFMMIGIKSHIRSLKAAQASRYLVSDAALYVKERCEREM
jgi:hypothetical protein